MSKNLILLASLAVTFLACNDGSSGSGSSGVTILDVRCGSDADCPSGFECEDEVEHGVSTSYCKSHGGDDGSADCPAGYELEVEHGSMFCKPHGGDDNSGHG